MCRPDRYVEMRTGWRHDWFDASHLRNIYVRDYVKGPFLHPRLVQSTPYAIVSAGSPRNTCLLRKPLSVKTEGDNNVHLKTGIPDPWDDYFVLKSVPEFRNRICKEEIESWRENLELTEAVSFYDCTGQGIPDPWKTWPKVEAMCQCEKISFQDLKGDLKEHFQRIKNGTGHTMHGMNRMNCPCCVKPHQSCNCEEMRKNLGRNVTSEERVLAQETIFGRRLGVNLKESLPGPSRSMRPEEPWCGEESFEKFGGHICRFRYPKKEVEDKPERDREKSEESEKVVYNHQVTTDTVNPFKGDAIRECFCPKVQTVVVKKESIDKIDRRVILLDAQTQVTPRGTYSVLNQTDDIIPVTKYVPPPEAVSAALPEAPLTPPQSSPPPPATVVIERVVEEPPKTETTECVCGGNLDTCPCKGCGQEAQQGWTPCQSSLHGYGGYPEPFYGCPPLWISSFYPLMCGTMPSMPPMSPISYCCKCRSKRSVKRKKKSRSKVKRNDEPEIDPGKETMAAGESESAKGSRMKPASLDQVNEKSPSNIPSLNKGLNRSDEPWTKDVNFENFRAMLKKMQIPKSVLKKESSQQLMITSFSSSEDSLLSIEKRIQINKGTSKLGQKDMKPKISSKGKIKSLGKMRDATRIRYSQDSNIAKRLTDSYEPNIDFDELSLDEQIKYALEKISGISSKKSSEPLPVRTGQMTFEDIPNSSAGVRRIVEVEEHELPLVDLTVTRPTLAQRLEQISYDNYERKPLERSRNEMIESLRKLPPEKSGFLIPEKSTLTLGGKKSSNGFSIEHEQVEEQRIKRVPIRLSSTTESLSLPSKSIESILKKSEENFSERSSKRDSRRHDKEIHFSPKIRSRTIIRKPTWSYPGANGKTLVKKTVSDVETFRKSFDLTRDVSPEKTMSKDKTIGSAQLLSSTVMRIEKARKMEPIGKSHQIVVVEPEVFSPEKKSMAAAFDEDIINSNRRASLIDDSFGENLEEVQLSAIEKQGLELLAISIEEVEQENMELPLSTFSQMTEQSLSKANWVSVEEPELNKEKRRLSTANKSIRMTLEKTARSKVRESLSEQGRLEELHKTGEIPVKILEKPEDISSTLALHRPKSLKERTSTSSNQPSTSSSRSFQNKKVSRRGSPEIPLRKKSGLRSFKDLLFKSPKRSPSPVSKKIPEKHLKQFSPNTGGTIQEPVEMTIEECEKVSLEMPHEMSFSKMHVIHIDDTYDRSQETSRRPSLAEARRQSVQIKKPRRVTIEEADVVSLGRAFEEIVASPRQTSLDGSFEPPNETAQRMQLEKKFYYITQPDEGGNQKPGTSGIGRRTSESSGEVESPSLEKSSGEDSSFSSQVDEEPIRLSMEHTYPIQVDEQKLLPEPTGPPPKVVESKTKVLSRVTSVTKSRSRKAKANSDSEGEKKLPWMKVLKSDVVHHGMAYDRRKSFSEPPAQEKSFEAHMANNTQQESTEYPKTTYQKDYSKPQPAEKNLRVSFMEQHEGPLGRTHSRSQMKYAAYNEPCRTSDEAPSLPLRTLNFDPAFMFQESLAADNTNSENSVELKEFQPQSAIPESTYQASYMLNEDDKMYINMPIPMPMPISYCPTQNFPNPVRDKWSKLLYDELKPQLPPQEKAVPMERSHFDETQRRTSTSKVCDEPASEKAVPLGRIRSDSPETTYRASFGKTLPEPTNLRLPLGQSRQVSFSQPRSRSTESAGCICTFEDVAQVSVENPEIVSLGRYYKEPGRSSRRRSIEEEVEEPQKDSQYSFHHQDKGKSSLTPRKTSQVAPYRLMIDSTGKFTQVQGAQSRVMSLPRSQRKSCQDRSNVFVPESNRRKGIKVFNVEHATPTEKLYQLAAKKCEEGTLNLGRESKVRVAPGHSFKRFDEVGYSKKRAPTPKKRVSGASVMSIAPPDEISLIRSVDEDLDDMSQPVLFKAEAHKATFTPHAVEVEHQEIIQRPVTSFGTSALANASSTESEAAVEETSIVVSQPVLFKAEAHKATFTPHAVEVEHQEIIQRPVTSFGTSELANASSTESEATVEETSIVTEEVVQGKIYRTEEVAFQSSQTTCIRKRKSPTVPDIVVNESIYLPQQELQILTKQPEPVLEIGASVKTVKETEIASEKRNPQTVKREGTFKILTERRYQIPITNDNRGPSKRPVEPSTKKYKSLTRGDSPSPATQIILEEMEDSQSKESDMSSTESKRSKTGTRLQVVNHKVRVEVDHWKLRPANAKSKKTDKQVTHRNEGTSDLRQPVSPSRRKRREEKSRNSVKNGQAAGTTPRLNPTTQPAENSKPKTVQVKGTSPRPSQISANLNKKKSFNDILHLFNPDLEESHDIVETPRIVSEKKVTEEETDEYDDNSQHDH